MKKTAVNEAQCAYQLKHNWRLEPHQVEHPKGESVTVPDESYSIRDLIKKYASGLDPGITKLANFSGEDEEVDFDDLDLASEARQDIAQVRDTMREHAARQKTLLEQMREREQKAPLETDVDGDDSEDGTESKSEENTRKSRKYKEPKTVSKETND